MSFCHNVKPLVGSRLVFNCSQHFAQPTLFFEYVCMAAALIYCLYYFEWKCDISNGGALGSTFIFRVKMCENVQTFSGRLIFIYF